MYKWRNANICLENKEWKKNYFKTILRFRKVETQCYQKCVNTVSFVVFTTKINDL